MLSWTKQLSSPRSIKWQKQTSMVPKLKFWCQWTLGSTQFGLEKQRTRLCNLLLFVETGQRPPTKQTHLLQGNGWAFTCKSGSFLKRGFCFLEISVFWCHSKGNYRIKETRYRWKIVFKARKWNFCFAFVGALLRKTSIVVFIDLRLHTQTLSQVSVLPACII